MATALELSQKYKSLLDKWEINTPLRKAHFFAQIDHESGMKPIRENMNYSNAERLRKIFYSPFKNKSSQFIQQYVNNPVKLANYVYANRNGNGNEASGDGWKYRAGGMIGTTGKKNFELLSKATGVDYVANPDLLNNEADALISALYYWKANGLNKYADLDNLDKVSDIINLGRLTTQIGDSNGYIDRYNKLQNYKRVFK